MDRRSAAKKGGQAGSLTHPIIYAVAARVKEADLAVRLLGHASDADLNTDHAVTTTHLGIKSEQLEDPRYANAWPMGFVIEIVFTLCQRGASRSMRASW